MNRRQHLPATGLMLCWIISARKLPSIAPIAAANTESVSNKNGAIRAIREVNSANLLQRAWKRGTTAWKRGTVTADSTTDSMEEGNCHNAVLQRNACRAGCYEIGFTSSAMAHHRACLTRCLP